MPFQLECNHERRLVIVRFTGSLDDDEMLASDDALRSLPPEVTGYDELIDAGSVASTTVKAETIRAVAQRPPFFSPGSRRAIVASGDVTFGVSRSFEQWRGDSAGTIRVFRSLADAVEWLDRKPERD